MLYMHKYDITHCAHCTPPDPRKRDFRRNCYVLPFYSLQLMQTCYPTITGELNITAGFPKLGSGQKGVHKFPNIITGA